MGCVSSSSASEPISAREVKITVNNTPLQPTIIKPQQQQTDTSSDHVKAPLIDNNNNHYKQHKRSKNNSQHTAHKPNKQSISDNKVKHATVIPVTADGTPVIPVSPSSPVVDAADNAAVVDSLSPYNHSPVHNASRTTPSRGSVSQQRHPDKFTRGSLSHIPHRYSRNVQEGQKRWEIMQDTLGKGHFARVKKCRDTATGLEYACKIIDKRDLVKNTAIVQAEIEILKAIKQHDHVVQLLDYFDDERHFYLIMELCFTREHQLLSKTRGWVWIDDLDQDEQVATYNEHKQCIEYEQIQRYIVKDVVEESMVNVTQDVHQINMITTADHDWYVAWEDSTLSLSQQQHYHKVPAYQLLSSSHTHPPQFTVLASAVNGVAVSSDTVTKQAGHLMCALGYTHEHELYAFLQLYGYALGLGLGLHWRQQRLEFHTESTQQKSYIEALLQSLQMDVDADIRLSNTEDERVCYAVIKQSWLDHLHEEYRGDHESCCYDWVWSLSKRPLRLILTGMMMAQQLRGCSVPSEPHSDGCVTTSSAILRDELIRLCLHAGYTAYFTEHHITHTDSHSDSHASTKLVDSWCVYYSDDVSASHPILSTSTDVHPSVYTGTVYCVTVPNGLLVARHATRASLSNTSTHPADSYCIATSASRPLIIGNCEGGDLFSKIVEQGKYTEQAAMLCCQQLASALLHIHQCGVVHRDLKPENILLTKENVLKVADFGLSKLLYGDVSNVDETSTDNTATIISTDGITTTTTITTTAADNSSTATILQRQQQIVMKTVCGTWAYCAPEVILRVSAYDHRVDIWTLGVLMFILLSGFHPFDEFGDSAEAILLDNIVKCQYNFDDPAWQDVSTTAKQLIQRLLVVDPNQRMTLEEYLESEWMQSDSEHAANAEVVLSAVPQKLSRLQQLRRSIQAVALAKVAATRWRTSISKAYEPGGSLTGGQGQPGHRNSALLSLTPGSHSREVGASGRSRQSIVTASNSQFREQEVETP